MNVYTYCSVCILYRSYTVYGILPHCEYIMYLNAYGSHAASSCVVFGNDDGFIIIIFDDVSITNYQFKTKWCPCESRSVLVFFRRIHWRTLDYLVTGVYGRIDFVQITVILYTFIFIWYWRMFTLFSYWNNYNKEIIFGFVMQ